MSSNLDGAAIWCRGTTVFPGIIGLSHVAIQYPRISSGFFHCGGCSNAFYEAMNWSSSRYSHPETCARRLVLTTRVVSARVLEEPAAALHLRRTYPSSFSQSTSFSHAHSRDLPCLLIKSEFSRISHLFGPSLTRHHDAIQSMKDVRALGNYMRAA